MPELFLRVVTLKCATLQFGITPDMIETTSLVDDQQRDLDTHDGPCAIHEDLCRLNLYIRSLIPFVTRYPVRPKARMCQRVPNLVFHLSNA